ncbi:MAG: MerR family transcriptional regulator [Polyangiaceae bacterium]|nr:MerR family transcriptional regulator [Myxococcales bacterium]MCC6899145.1 MerR family transcriptional regulator [Polyangiaceae bacterium]
MADIPVKLYYRIGEVAEIVGVEPHVLRYWETEFRSIRPSKSAKGQRVYSRRDVEKLMKVKDLLYSHGFTIAGARKRLRQANEEPAPAPGPAPTASVAPPLPSVRQTLLGLRADVAAMLADLGDDAAAGEQGRFLSAQRLTPSG